MVKILPTDIYFAGIKQSLEESGQAFVRVTGDSMRPLLRHLEDGVFIVPVERIKRGDIVLFDRRNGRYVLHRVIRVRGDYFSMCGDNQWRMDRKLPAAQVVGRVQWIQRGSKVIPADKWWMKAYAWLRSWIDPAKNLLYRMIHYVKRKLR